MICVFDNMAEGREWVRSVSVLQYFIKKLYLTEKISTLDEKLNASEASIEKLNDKITNLERKLAYFESQDELKSDIWKIDDLEQYGRRESLRFSGFEVKENESKEEC